MTTTTDLTPLTRLTRDLRDAAATLTDAEARYLVDAYYIQQEGRKRADNQTRALDASGEPHTVIQWLAEQTGSLERQIARALDVYTNARLVGQWARSQVGIGPIISANLMAHIDITKAPTAGHIYRFGGIDASNKWLGRDGAKELVDSLWSGPKNAEACLYQICEKLKRRPDSVLRFVKGKEGDAAITKANLISAFAKRPWNADLKVLFWKIGQSFMKNSGKPDCVYGKLYLERKAYEVERDQTGGNAEKAALELTTRTFRDKETKEMYQSGHFPAGRLELMAERWAVKKFLSHWHKVAFRERFGHNPAPPYAIGILGHAHEIPVPNWPWPDDPQ